MDTLFPIICEALDQLEVPLKEPVSGQSACTDIFEHRVNYLKTRPQTEFPRPNALSIPKNLPCCRAENDVQSFHKRRCMRNTEQRANHLFRATRVEKQAFQPTECPAVFNVGQHDIFQEIVARVRRDPDPSTPGEKKVSLFEWNRLHEACRIFSRECPR